MTYPKASAGDAELISRACDRFFEACCHCGIRDRPKAKSYCAGLIALGRDADSERPELIVACKFAANDP
jgi:hypothetical protein